MRESFYLTLDTRDREREEPVGRKAKEQRDRDSDRDIEEMIQLLHLTFKLFCLIWQHIVFRDSTERIRAFLNA